MFLQHKKELFWDFMTIRKINEKMDLSECFPFMRNINYPFDENILNTTLF